MSPAGLRALVLLSVLAAVVTIALKATAYLSLHYSHRPVDATHTYGHQKIEFFSSGLEGMLIVVAGVGTVWVAVGRLIDPQPLTALGLGTGLALGASAVNLVVG